MAWRGEGGGTGEWEGAMKLPLRCAAIAVLVATSTQPALAQCRHPPAARAEANSQTRMPGDPGMLRRFGIAQTDSFVWVTDAATCRQAVESIAKDAEVSADSFTIVLARIGRYYVGESDRQIAVWDRTFVFDSTMTLQWLRDTLVSISNFYQGPPPTESRCHDANLPVLGKIRFVLTDPRQQWYRDLLGINGIPVDSVHHVAGATTCARARESIKRYFNGHHEHVQFTLFRVGRFHWAETSYPMAGEWSLVFILDSTATRVVGQY
jgi:hypothetical protein